MRTRLLVVAMVAVVSVSSCRLPYSNSFEVKNETGSQLTNVRVLFADAVGHRKSLGVGEVYSFHPSPKHDGEISISYIERGTPVEHKLGYIAPPIPAACKFKITGNDVIGECK